MALRAGIAAAAIAFAFSAQAKQDFTTEEEFWAVASTSGSLETVELFIETYPDGVHTMEALRLTMTLKEDQKRREMEEKVFAMTGAVTFSTPIAFGAAEIMGHTLKDVLTTAPAFPPIEGLPDSYWKSATCNSCHTWTRETLCVQANTYIKAKPARYQEKQHPFGGSLKMNMRNWAKGGCQ